MCVCVRSALVNKLYCKDVYCEWVSCLQIKTPATSHGALQRIVVESFLDFDEDLDTFLISDFFLFHRVGDVPAHHNKVPLLVVVVVCCTMS